MHGDRTAQQPSQRDYAIVDHLHNVLSRLSHSDWHMNAGCISFGHPMITMHALYGCCMLFVHGVDLQMHD